MTRLKPWRLVGDGTFIYASYVQFLQKNSSTYLFDLYQSVSHTFALSSRNNKTRYKMKILSLLLILLPLKTFAMDNDSDFSTYGDVNCGEYVSQFKKQQTAQSGYLHKDFIQTYGKIIGFITAWNYLSPNGKVNILGTTTLDGVNLWLNNWCNKNPLKSHYEGLIESLEELEGDAWKYPIIWKDTAELWENSAELWKKRYLDK